MDRPRALPQGTSPPKERISDRIKAALKQAMLEGEFAPGDKLPPEARLAEIYKASKVSAREALREMEAEGLILKRRGIFGGSFVAEPGAEKMTEVISNAFLFGGITAESMAEFRRLMEPGLIALAACRRTLEDLERMEKAIAAIDASIQAGHPDQTAAFRFHLLIADACHNPFISSLMQALMDVFQQVLARTPDMDTAKTDIAFNRRFLAAIRDRDEQEATLAMNEHFNFIDDLIQNEKALKREAE